MLKDKSINELFKLSWKPHKFLPGAWPFHHGKCALCAQHINEKIHSQSQPSADALALVR